jgi:DNA-binding response OmpR family regulator
MQLLWQSPVVRSSTELRSQFRVLIADDDPNLTRLLRATLRSAGYQVVSAEDGEKALSVVEQENPDVIILDLRMPKLDGRGFFRELRARGVRTPVLIASAFGARSGQLELGAEASIEKPFDPDRLVEVVAELLPPENDSTSNRRRLYGSHSLSFSLLADKPVFQLRFPDERSLSNVSFSV